MRFSSLLQLQFIFISLGSFLVLSPSANSWWDHGHETIGQVGESVLTQASRKKVSQLLEYALAAPGSLDLSKVTSQMGSASIWADYLKQPLFKGNSNKDSFGTQCHFVNVKVGTEEILTLSKNPTAIQDRVLFSAKAGKNSISCTRAFIQILRGPETAATIANRAIALRYLLHVVGDIHQPLHNFSIYSSIKYSDGNTGGSQLVIPFFKIPVFTSQSQPASRTNVKDLHALWDAGLGAFSQMPRMTIVQSGDMAKVGTLLESQAVALNAEVLKKNPAFLNTVAADKSPSLEKWAAEGIFVGLSGAYFGLDRSFEDFEYGTTFVDKARYRREGQAMMLRQLAVGGYRLGFLLNAIFDPKNATESYVKLVDEILL